MNKQAEALLRHPKIKALKQKLEHTIQLSTEKAIAHLQYPGTYPLPENPQTLERAIYNLVSSFSERRQRKLAEQIAPLLNGSETVRRNVYGDLAAVQLKTNRAVIDQVMNLPSTKNTMLTGEEANQLAQQVKPVNTTRKTATAKKVAVAVPQAIAAGTVDIFVDTLTCNKNSEIGKDEIILEAIFTNGLGNTVTTPPIDLGKFKKGDSKAVSANPLFTFDIFEDSTGSVQNLSAILLLREKDKIRDENLALKIGLIISLIAAALGLLALGIAIVGTALALTSQALFVVMLVSMFTGLTLGPIGSWLIPLLADDLSNTVTDILNIDANIQVGDVEERTVNFTLRNDAYDLTPGSYTAKLRWVKTS